MLILAIDQSSEYGSLALLRDERVLGERTWTDRRGHCQSLFEQVANVMSGAGVEWTQINCYAVGLGPGSYTGLRIALAAALGFAMPDRRRVYGVSSAEALAGVFLADSDAASVMVIGDARRHQLWARVFTLREGLGSAVTPWMLRSAATLAECRASAWITPDWERLGPLMKAQAPADVLVIEKQQTPSATSVGHAAFRRIRAKLSSDPLTPIYLHPAVALPRSSSSPPVTMQSKRRTKNEEQRTHHP